MSIIPLFVSLSVWPNITFSAYQNLKPLTFEMFWSSLNGSSFTPWKPVACHKCHDQEKNTQQARCVVNVGKIYFTLVYIFQSSEPPRHYWPPPKHLYHQVDRQKLFPIVPFITTVYPLLRLAFASFSLTHLVEYYWMHYLLRPFCWNKWLFKTRLRISLFSEKESLAFLTTWDDNDFDCIGRSGKGRLLDHLLRALNTFPVTMM